MSEQQQQQQPSTSSSSATSAMQDFSGLCVINVKATWQSDKNKKDVSIQTQHLSTMESGAQTQSASTAEDEAHRVNACEGTDDRFAVPTASPAGSGWVYAGDHFDEQDVANFLSSVHGDITKELKKMSKSSAFDNYEPGWKEKSSVGAKLVNTFPSVVFLESGKSSSSPSSAAGNISSSNTNPNHQPLQVTGVSWNASNALVAASYGRVDSYTWSTGSGFVAVWPASGPVVTANNNNKDAANVGGEGGDNKENAADDASGKKSKKSSSKATLSSPKGGANSGEKNEVDGPLILLETDAFATCVAFHPTVPTLVAAATFSGEVLLWDIASTDDASASSVKPLCSNFGTHSQYGGGSSSSNNNNNSSSSSTTNKDPINKLVWIQNPREPREAHKYLLCSASSDGTIAFWNPSNKFSDPIGLGTLQNRRRASLGVQSIAFLATAIPTGTGSNSGSNSGGSSNKRIPTQEAPMVMATDSGDVVRGKVPAKAVVVPTKGGKDSKTSPTTTTGTTATQQQQVVPLNNTEFFENHSGPTNAIDASPFFRNVFLTCSSDGSVRLYTLLDMQHKLALVPSPDTKHFLYAASFSPIRPGVIAACSRSSQIHIFDLGESRVKPAFTLDRAGTEDSAVLCLGWSSSGASFATGDSKGCVRIWAVTNSLCETTELERHAIRFAERASNNNNNKNVSPGRNNNNNTNNNPSASAKNALAADGGEDDGRLGGFDNAALTQSMLIAGKGDVAGAGGAGGHHFDPVQALLGFTP